MSVPRTMTWTALTLVGLLGIGSLFATGTTEVLTQGNTKIGNRVWPDAMLPVVWRFHDPSTVPGCYSNPNAPPETLLPELQVGFDVWQNDPDSRIAYTYGGLTTVRNDGADGINVVTFCDSEVLASNMGFLGAVSSFALTVQTTVAPSLGCIIGQGFLPAGFCFPVGTYPAGTMIDADILYNSYNTIEESLATNGAIGGLDPSTQIYELRELAAHETGHFAGLSHDPLTQATMAPVVGPNPPTNGVGKYLLSPSDRNAAGRYYPEPSYATAYGSITGLISLDGIDADGVHVVAIDPVTMLGVAGRFSLTRFADATAPGPEGPDFTAQGPGFYRIDGLPPGDYYVYVEYFDDSELLGRLGNRYNYTVANSNVVRGGPTGALGFRPALTEFYDAGESGNGGDGVSPGTALDNADAATLVTVTAGAVTPNIDIAINIEPPNGQTPALRQNPTTRVVIPNDLLSSGDILWNFFLDGGGDDYWAIRFPVTVLPSPPFNVAEGVWVHGGLSTAPMVTRLAFAKPGSPGIPDLDNPVVGSAGRSLTGGPGGLLPENFVNDVCDQWNVTVNEARDIFAIVHQPDAPGGLTFPEAFLALATCSNATCTSPARVGRTIVTQDGGANWSALTNADLFYDLVVELDPPVMITGAAPDHLNAGETGDVLINGFGFRSGAAVSFGPGITVNGVEWLSAQQLRANITIPLMGATEPRSVDVRITNPGVLFPNVSRVFTVLPLLDDDGDGAPNLTDCAPLDAALKSPATEVVNIRVAFVAGSAEVSWDSQGGTAGAATVYDIVTGDLAALKADGGYAAAVCAGDDRPDTPFADTAPLAPGEGRYWLIRACNACNAGACTYGDANVIPDPRDALDAAPPCP